jgi:hypothetical protein
MSPWRSSSCALTLLNLTQKWQTISASEITTVTATGKEKFLAAHHFTQP